MTVPISILDLAAVGPDETVGDAFACSVALAQRAEELGYHRIWYAEHHNISAIASSATAVLIAHIAANTERIRLGAGGIMLPNHSPLVIAEQFGTLAALHPNRIDLGLGRAPGSDQQTWRALRRDPRAAESFLGDETRGSGVYAIPGRGTNVPLYILGSSLFGAQLAALLGLPYGFASHFAPHALHDALTIYRDRFEPSVQLALPYSIAGVNVIVADSEDDAQEQLRRTRRQRARHLFSRGDQPLTAEQIDEVLASPMARHVDQMLMYTAVGTPATVRQYLDDFQQQTSADELIVVMQADTADGRLRSLALVADAMALPGS
jgi:luciferase family oxidoreductase group 1